MRPEKKPLTLNRETLRQLTSPELAGIQGGIGVRTAMRCPTVTCPVATQAHSCFDSCYDSQCCLEVP